MTSARLRNLVAAGLILSIFWLLPVAPASSQGAPAGSETQIIVASTCLAGNGRIDVNLVNRSSATGVYRIELGNLSARQLTIDAGSWGRMRTTGRPDGDLDLRITHDGVEIRNEPVEVRCDTNPVQVLSPEVQIISACVAGNGFVLFQFANRTASSRSWVIEFEGVPNRSTTTAPWGAAVRGTSGRPDGVYDVVVRSGPLRMETTVTVDCDAPVGEPRPAPVQNLQVTQRSATSIEVTWANDADPRRRSFDFFVNNEWVTYIRDGNATSHVFTGLTPDTPYTLGVTALGDPNEYEWLTKHFSPRTNIQGTTTAANVVLWEDNFDFLDTSVWKLEHSTYGDGGNSIHCYRQENVSVQNGKLVLRAKDEIAQCPNEVRDVSSGMVRSEGVTFSPGQAIEFRVKLTPGDDANQSGLWPAVWVSGLDTQPSGWPLNGEIDMFEAMTAADPTRSIYSIHYQQPDGTKGKQNKPVYEPGNLSDEWHDVRFEYGLNGQLVWFLDGEMVFDIASRNPVTAQGWPSPFTFPATELKITFAIGGDPGPLDRRALSNGGATFELDYIRILAL